MRLMLMFPLKATCYHQKANIYINTPSTHYRSYRCTGSPRWLECSPMAQETWVQSQVKSYQRLKKWYLMPPCLTLSIIRQGSRVKWSNLREGVVPFPTPRVVAIEQGAFWLPTLLYLLYIKCSEGKEKQKF